MNFLVHVLALSAIYGVWGVSHGFLARYLGLTSLAGAVLAGAGAYSFAAFSDKGQSGPISLLIAVAVSALLGGLLVLSGARVRGHNFVLATFCVSLVWDGLARNLELLTGGAFGIPGVPPVLFGDFLGAPLATFLLSGALLSLTSFLVIIIRTRRLGTAFALTERSTDLARNYGAPFRWLLFCAGAAMGCASGLAGMLNAAYVGFVGPTSFPFAVSITIAAIAMCLPRGWTAFVIALLAIVALPEALRFYGLSGSSAAFLRQALSGVVLLIILLLPEVRVFRRRGRP